MTRIRGKDLFTCEAVYHKSCRNKNAQDPTKWRSANDEEIKQQLGIEEAHKTAFRDACQVIARDILQKNKKKKNDLKLTSLTAIYIHSIRITKFPNPNGRGENLKAKLQQYSWYAAKLSFCKLGHDGVYQSYVALSTSLPELYTEP